MTAKDRWEINLTCPECGATGTADVFQYDGWSFSGDHRTHVSSVTDGFRIKNATSKRETDEVYCVKCEAKVR